MSFNNSKKVWIPKKAIAAQQERLDSMRRIQSQRKPSAEKVFRDQTPMQFVFAQNVQTTAKARKYFVGSLKDISPILGRPT